MTGGLDPTQLIVEIENQSPCDAKSRLLTYRDLFRMVQQSRNTLGRPVVVSDAEDELLSHERGYGKGSRPEDYLE